MKFLIHLILAVPSAAFFSSSGFADQLIDPKDKHDAGAVMQKLNGMVAASQQKLGLAERHHKKVVNRVRKEADAMLEEQAKAYGDALNAFGLERERAEDELQAAIRSGKAGLEKAEAAAANSTNWNDPEVSVRAKLGAQLASSDRANKKNARHRLRQVREGEEAAEGTLEDNAQKLGMKLGDMTPLVDKAKKTVESVAEKTVAAAKQNITVQAASKHVNLTSSEDELKTVSAKSQAAISAANKKLDGFLSKIDKDVATKTAKIQEDLQKAQHEEIDKVLGQKPVVVNVAAKKSMPAVGKKAKHVVAPSPPAQKKVDLVKAPKPAMKKAVKTSKPELKKGPAIKSSK
jgi:hypothetical protein